MGPRTYHTHALTVAFVALLSLEACQAATGKSRVLNIGAQQRTIRGILGNTECTPARSVPVTSTEDVVHAIKLAATAHAQGKKLIVRATQTNHVTYNNFSCVAGASEAAQTVWLDLSKMNELIEISGQTISVQAGMTFEELEEHLLRQHLSLPGVYVTPALASMSLGAAIATAAHGSSLIGPATITAFVTRAVMVDGTGQTHVLERPQTLLEGSMGLLGVITELTIEVVPAKKVAVKQIQEEDREIVGDLREVIENSQAVAIDVLWSPTAGVYTARVWQEADSDAEGEAENVYMQGEAKTHETLNNKILRDQQDLLDRGSVMCQVVGDLMSAAHLTASPASQAYDPSGARIGWLNRVAGARCATPGTCLLHHVQWVPHELSINSEDFADWVDDVRLIMTKARGCQPFLFHLRFVMESPGLIAPQSGQQVVSIEIDTVKGLNSKLPLKHQAVYDEIVQVLLCKYNARPNLGLASNREVLSSCALRDSLGENWDVFAAMQQRYDPQGLFAPPLWHLISHRKSGVFYEGCAMAQDCFCREDSHCGPLHKCVPAGVFREYSVCMADVWADTREL